MPHACDRRVRRVVRRTAPPWAARDTVRRAAAPSRIALACVLLVGSAACGSAGQRVYEYEEVLYLSLDGSAELYVNGSVPALVALRGMDLDVNPRARLDRDALRTAYSSSVTRVTHVGSSRRTGRRFVHLRIEVDDVRRLNEVGPLAWSKYAFERRDEDVVFRQSVGQSAGRDVGQVGWTGAEIAAFRLHLPSRILYHNAPSREVGRGNFVAWEQRLRNRLAGDPISAEVRLDTRTILYRTLWLFGAMIVLVLVLVAGVILWMVRSGRGPALHAPPSGDRA